MHSQKTLKLLDLADEADDEENKRLLYVAVTRASDQLYICGYDSKNTPRADNWYDLIIQSVTNGNDITEPYQIKTPQLKTPDIKKEKQHFYQKNLQ